MPKTIQQAVTFRAVPRRLFDVYLSSREQSAATGAKAVISRRVGGTFTAHGGHLRGQNLALVPGRLVVQSWRASNWKKRDLDSTLVLVFTRAPGGGRIAMTHVNVPDANAASITRGWSEYYWKPLRKYLKRARKGDRR